MPSTAPPRAFRLLSALSVGLAAAVVTALAVLAAMAVLRPAEPGEDWGGAFALLIAPPAQLLTGSWVAWRSLDGPTPSPRRAWARSVGGALALVATVLVPLALAGSLGAWRTLGVALVGLAVGGAAPAVAEQVRRDGGEG